MSSLKELYIDSPLDPDKNIFKIFKKSFRGDPIKMEFEKNILCF